MTAPLVQFESQCIKHEHSSTTLTFLTDSSFGFIFFVYVLRPRMALASEYDGSMLEEFAVDLQTDLTETT